MHTRDIGKIVAESINDRSMATPLQFIFNDDSLECDVEVIVLRVYDRKTNTTVVYHDPVGFYRDPDEVVH